MPLEGLEELRDLDKVLVHQEVENLEFLLGNTAPNRYKIKDPSGRVLFYTIEHSNAWARLLIGKQRALQLKWLTPIEREVMTVSRKYSCSLFGCCFPKCLEYMDVWSAGHDTSYGSVRQVMTGRCTMGFGVFDTDGDQIFKIVPPDHIVIFSEFVFELVDARNNEKIGEIRKKSKGVMKELFTSADNFEITFPANMDVKLKAMLINACLLCDLIYFESNK